MKPSNHVIATLFFRKKRNDVSGKLQEWILSSKKSKSRKGNYSCKNDGSIRVNDRSYNSVKQEWKQRIGNTKFVDERDDRRLNLARTKQNQ